MTTPNEAIEIQGAAGQSVWRAAMYRVLALAFSYPDADTFEQLAVDLEELCRHPLTAAKGLLPAATALRDAAREATAPALGARHNALFAGEVACSPYETEYEFDAFAKARQLADIAGFYRAFGLKAAEGDRAEPADSIAAEMDFLSHLAVKLAFAETGGLAEHVEVTLEAARSFVEDHPGQWVPLFCRTLVGLDEIDSFYGAAACLCDAFVQQEVEYLDAHPRPVMMRRVSHDPEEVFTCPMAGPAIDQEEDLG